MTEVVRTRCCIAGGGPAGMMLGLLLARAGVEVLVLEKHADFLRDFRGDTIHPSTLEVLDELGLLEGFLARPHQKVARATVRIGAEALRVADFAPLSVRYGYIAFIPQWDFLDFLSGAARAYPGFALRMKTDVQGLIIEEGAVVGLRARSPEGPVEVRADLVVGADGRSSRVREDAGLPVRNVGAPIDVLWFRLSRRPGDPDESFARFAAGRILVFLGRDDYWQCAYVIPKDGRVSLQAEGLEAFQAGLGGLEPFLGDRPSELRSWDDLKLLTVKVDRLERWARPGLLCIGDAAHAMSPIGGVGINLAIQDAVAAANLLAGPLRDGPVPIEALRRVQDRRAWPTRVTQRLQVAAQNGLIAPTLARSERLTPPAALRLLDRFALLRRIPGRLIGWGVRPEHVSSPDFAFNGVAGG